MAHSQSVKLNFFYKNRFLNYICLIKGKICLRILAILQQAKLKETAMKTSVKTSVKVQTSTATKALSASAVTS